MESTFSPWSKEPPPHYHPKHAEDIKVISGEITVRLKDRIIKLKEEQSLHIPKNTVHAVWNSTGKKAVVNWRVRPALNFDNFLEVSMGLAADGKIRKNGMPGLLHTLLLEQWFSDVFRLPKPLSTVQKILFKLLSPIACLSGLRSAYKHYID